jgi:hypothetical protein
MASGKMDKQSFYLRQPPASALYPVPPLPDVVGASFTPPHVKLEDVKVATPLSKGVPPSAISKPFEPPSTGFEPS